MSKSAHSSRRWHTSEEDAATDHDTSSSAASHRRTSDSTEPSSRSSGLGAPTFIPSTSQNMRNDRLQAKMKDLAFSDERDGGGKSLGATTKWIKRSRAAKDHAPPTFKGGVVGQPAEIDPRGGPQSKRQRLTAAPRRLEELFESASPQLLHLGPRTSSARPSGSLARGATHAVDSESTYLRNGHPGRNSPPPDWLASILSEADSLPAPPQPPHPHDRTARPAPAFDQSMSDYPAANSHRPMELPPTPYSLPADLHNPVQLGGPPTPSRPFFEAQLARVSPTRMDFFPPNHGPAYPNHLHWFPDKLQLPTNRPEDDRPPYTPPPIPRAQSLFSSPTRDNSQPFHPRSPLENLNQLNHDLAHHPWDQEDAITPYESILHSSSSDRDRRTPSLFAESSDSEVGTEFWTRPNFNDASLIPPQQPIDRTATSNDRYAAALARMASEQVRTNSILEIEEMRPLTSTPNTSLAAERNPQQLTPKSFKTPTTGLYREERFGTPPLPPQNSREARTEPALFTIQEKGLEGPPSAEIFLRASSAPPMLILEGEALDETDAQENGTSVEAIREGDQDEEMNDAADRSLGTGRDTRSTTAGDSNSTVRTGFAATTITEHLTMGTSEPDEDDFLLQRMIEDEEKGLAYQGGGGEERESWSFWEDTSSEMYDD
ncbi:BZ3500_MvSof-1268-A1-R1_Chr9g10518 [Microbotryum saponariae]|uniref:BZ3500_MvSof-1268-A1-R1_Chr9g10518 protein n=1 Tax=Microbotryum saponariae TaxID=289078 RepID=A0A2X0KFV5_9BASI|nr:BZ3501_MvSof-1269-A2-R1_Chr9g10267 [Microbotryum saponariae]SDA00228.1 BZ3500_MvSof-1268-A1-R1_Chr9g10518 [Microbotryum saponariae]